MGLDVLPWLFLFSSAHGPLRWEHLRSYLSNRTIFLETGEQWASRVPKLAARPPVVPETGQTTWYRSWSVSTSTTSGAHGVVTETLRDLTSTALSPFLKQLYSSIRAGGPGLSSNWKTSAISMLPCCPTTNSRLNSVSMS